MSHPGKQPYRSDIDGLRALAVGGVAIFHAFPQALPGGFAGVDVFFVISGFLITSLILAELRTGRFSLASFYGRRIRRIFPALAFILSVVLVFAWYVCFDDEYRAIGRHTAGGAAFISNLLFWQEAGYFDKSAALKPLLHLWSLGVEEQFYIIFPLLAWLAFRIRSNLQGMVVVLIALSFAANLKLAATNHTADFFSPVARMWELGIGCALAVFSLGRESTTTRRQSFNAPLHFSQHIIHELAACLGLALTLGSFFVLTASSVFPGWSAILPTIGCALLIWAGDKAAINRRLLSARPLVWLGLISFPLYLWHWPILSFLRVLSFEEPSPGIRAFALIVAVGLACLTYIFVEKPFRFGGYRRSKIVALSLWVLLVGTFGFVVYLQNGIPARTANNGSAIFAEIADPYRAMRSDGSCETFLGLQQQANETCIVRSNAPEFLIMGDSQAMAFNSAVWADRVSLNSVVLAGYSCLPFRKYIPIECSAIAQRALDLLAKTPSITTVLLVNIGGDSYTDRTFQDGVQQLSPHDAFIKGYSDLIEEIHRRNKKIIFVVAAPGLLAEPRACFQARVLSIGNRDRVQCEISRNELDTRYQNYRSMIGEIGRAYPELLIYDVARALCDDHGCPGMDGDHLLYFDVSHLSVHGSAKVLNDFSAWYHAGSSERASEYNNSAQFSPSITDAPEFVTQGHWSDGYVSALTRSGAVVVGPGTNNSNVFAQRFFTFPGTSYKAVARASSTTDEKVEARIQVNWEAADGRFLGMSGKTVEIGPHETQFELYLSAPELASVGILYVTPAGDRPVRYTEMRLLRLPANGAQTSVSQLNR
jgi:peptidoglycan/LPS O-acetylase OafA/YrhL